VLGTVSLATVAVLGVAALGAVRLPSPAHQVFGSVVLERGGVAGDTSVVAPVVSSAGPDALPRTAPSP
jgi:hypothetical protein